MAGVFVLSGLAVTVVSSFGGVIESRVVFLHNRIGLVNTPPFGHPSKRGEVGAAHSCKIRQSK